MKSIGLTIALALMACVDDPTTIDTVPKLSANAVTPEQLFNTALDAAVLDQANLDQMASSADARLALRYVMACALAEGQVVTASYIDDAGQSATIDFHGFMGLAPAWTDAALTTSAQQLVSGCILALVNRIGGSVMVSLRGPHGGLATTSNELQGYKLQEGAFFGNIFRGGEGAIACKGSGNSVSAGRDCAKPMSGDATQCGFSYAGLCSSVCSTSNGYFVNCTKNGITYPTPVSTYLYQ
jgi:hypothetical protein